MPTCPSSASLTSEGEGKGQSLKRSSNFFVFGMWLSCDDINNIIMQIGICLNHSNGLFKGLEVKMLLFLHF